MIDERALLEQKSLFVSSLASVVYTAPNEERVKAILAGSDPLCSPPWLSLPDMAQGVEALTRWRCSEATSDPLGVVEALRSDHFCLIEGAGTPLAPPWESLFFRDGERLFGPQTMLIRELYASCGLAIEGKGSEPDDHLGLELSFAAYAFRRRYIDESATHEMRELCLGALRSLLEDHLACWVERWTFLMVEHARTDFYRAVAHFVQGAVRGLREDVEREAERAMPRSW